MCLVEQWESHYCWRVWLVFRGDFVEGQIIGSNYRYVFLSAVMTRVEEREEMEGTLRWNEVIRRIQPSSLRRWILYHGAGQLSIAVSLLLHI